jgi:ribosomal protein S18 acetylase RimI-like enzyme
MSEPSIEIRRATAADNLLLAELGAQTFRDTFGPDNTPENMAAYLASSFSPLRQASELADPVSSFLIAEVEGATVGYARLKEGQPLEAVVGPRPIEIVRLYAVKEWIGRGVGAALMRACLDEARTRGCDVIWLDVWEHNLRARAFYRKWGFSEAGTQPFKLGDDMQTDLLMRRPVNT